LEISDLSTDFRGIAGWFSSGNYLLDEILGGGYAYSRSYELYGLPSSGKSLLALEAAKSALADGKNVLFLDTENALSQNLLEGMGFVVKINKKKMDISYAGKNMIYGSPDTMEDVFETIHRTIDISVQKDLPILVVWDTVVASPPVAMVNADSEKALIGIMARQLSWLFPKLNWKLKTSKVTLLMLNQARQNIGPFPMITSPGGWATKHYQTGRIFLKTTGKFTLGDDQLGSVATPVIEKLKVARPGRRVNLALVNNNHVQELTKNGVKYLGISEAYSAFFALKYSSKFKTVGSWFTLDTEQGVLKFQKRTFPELYDKNKEEIRKIVIETVK